MDEELKACRYRVEKTGYGFWPYCVRAGDGTRELFKGHQKQCMVVAAELETAFEDGKFVAERAILLSQGGEAAVPDGHALIPARIELSPEDIACIMLQCGGDEEATEIDEQFNGGVLWVGSLRDDDGSETYGLHIACVGYLEEGSTTIAEFAAAPAQQQPQEVVLATDYAALEAECKRLLDLLADWSSHFTGPKVIGGPLSSLRERTDAALLGGDQ